MQNKKEPQKSSALNSIATIIRLIDPSIPVFYLLFTTARITSRNNQLRHLIRSIEDLALSGDLAGGAAVAGRNIESWVSEEEVSRTEEQGHGLGGHDGEILWGGEVSDAESVPEHDVSVVDRGVAVSDPFWDTAGGLA